MRCRTNSREPHRTRPTTRTNITAREFGVTTSRVTPHTRAPPFRVRGFGSGFLPRRRTARFEARGDRALLYSLDPHFIFYRTHGTDSTDHPVQMCVIRKARRPTPTGFTCAAVFTETVADPTPESRPRRPPPSNKFEPCTIKYQRARCTRLGCAPVRDRVTVPVTRRTVRASIQYTGYEE